MSNEKKNPFNYLFFMLSVFVAGSVLFLAGFFPMSKNLIGRAEQQYYDKVQPNKLGEYTLRPPLPKYDRTIFMIIDAWRSDYPNMTNMPFSFQNACNHLQIKVDIPTVTMPRLKSITTGTISNFIDIVLNLGHTSELDDSILHRLTEKNKKSVFAGDRTWIQLFPNEFLRKAVNEDSFFVNDFYEGDLNVTKSLMEELKLSDWNLMVLHYLGLDHIGHVEGSHSDKIFMKLLEMDNIVKNIVTHQFFEKSLLLLTGDHGMRNGGSHGGSDREELYVPLMGFHENCDKLKRSNSEYNQIDITTTLAMLLDVRIPHTSIGCLIPELLEEGYSRQDQLYFYYYNTLHLMEKWKARFSLQDAQFEDYFSWYRDAKMSHKEFISSEAKSSMSFEKAKQNYIRLSKHISQLLSDSMIRYDNVLITIALSLTTLCALKLILNVLSGNVSNSLEINSVVLKTFFICSFLGGCINFVAHFFGFFNTQGFVSTILLTFPIALSTYFIIDVSKLIFFLIMSRKVIFRLSIPFVLLLLFLCHTVSLTSSSFIEEEHQTWYYFTPSLLVFLTLQNFYNDVKSVWQKNKSIETLLAEFWNMRFVFILLMFINFCRRLNQTGDKWRHLVDIGDILARSDNYAYLILIHLAGLLALFLLLKKYNSSLGMFFCFVALCCVFLYRQGKLDSFMILMIFWISVVGRAVVNYRDICCKHNNYGYEIKGNLVELLKTNMTCSFLISALLHKPHNVILLPVLLYTLEISYNLCDNLHLKGKRVYNRSYVLVLKTVMTIFIANMFYFFQGNSNSLTTIDINPGYIGLKSYNPFVVGVFITLNTYCAPINTFLYLIWHMFATQRNLLPIRQEKEQISNMQLLESTEEDLHLVYSLYTATTVMPVAVYWCILVGFRYHLFIYSVFAPKAFYECFHLLVFYLNFILTNLYFRLFLK
ncbi:GPI ethanolamine phosphate transferase 2 isoform X1 [Lucilia cuprina]|uniref:GPI ethanolamine phosphate transferase 2 isoform X1 n=2 Tax=Lucilia cuprina TaxID=7375 RepID=UPI001F053E44|nr:GPI ethanolamine phosphate transferase 2 isoform X1 [Lucilia cuprina]